MEIDLLNTLAAAIAAPPAAAAGAAPVAAATSAPAAAPAPAPASVHPHPSESDFRAAFKDLTGATSTPRFFLGSKFIGGADDLAALDSEGKLEPMLKEAGLILPHDPTSQALLSVRSKLSYEAVLAQAGPTIATFKYGMLHSYNLTKTLQAKGQDFSQPVSVLEVCKPAHAKNVLQRNVQISAALPCRISVWWDSARSEAVLQSIRPELLIGMFGEESLRELALEVQGDLFSIMHAMA